MAYNMKGFSGFGKGTSPLKHKKDGSWTGHDHKTKLGKLTGQVAETIGRYKKSMKNLRDRYPAEDITLKEAEGMAMKSVVIPEIEVTAKRGTPPEKKYTQEDLDNAPDRETRGAIMYHARKNNYEIGGKKVKLVK